MWTNEWCSRSTLSRAGADLAERVHLGWPEALVVRLLNELELADLRMVLQTELELAGLRGVETSGPLKGCYPSPLALAAF